MKLKFSTEYGEIEVSSQALKALIKEAMVNSYGIVDLSNPSVFSGIVSMFSDVDKGIKLVDDGVNIKADIYVVVEYGTNIPQVAKNLQDSIIYNLTNYAGKEPLEVNVHVVDVSF